VAVGIQMKSKPLDQVRSDVPIVKEEIVRVNINVPESVRQAWKIAAVKSKKPMTELIIDAMSAYLNTHMSK
jgi:hypothetical protein